MLMVTLGADGKVMSFNSSAAGSEFRSNQVQDVAEEVVGCGQQPQSVRCLPSATSRDQSSADFFVKSWFPIRAGEKLLAHSIPGGYGGAHG